MTKFNFPKLCLQQMFSFSLILAYDKDESDGHFVILRPHTKSKWVVDSGDQGYTPTNCTPRNCLILSLCHMCV
jgi:hypothetical protein